MAAVECVTFNKTNVAAHANNWRRTGMVIRSFRGGRRWGWRRGGLRHSRFRDRRTAEVDPEDQVEDRKDGCCSDEQWCDADRIAAVVATRRARPGT
jgi:hypothetical protein